MTFTLNHLTDTEFENFCFDLLQSLDFVNLNWRKGTGLQSSPSDQGRDIQGQMLRKDIDGREHHENWFVECKHYIKGVPPEKIQGAITWANAHQPDVLLIIVSNFLSNPAKNYIEEYERTNKQKYRIKVWELKDLENITTGKNDICRKYNLASELSFLTILNSYHLAYVMKPQLNKMEYFIELMDNLDSHKRDEAFSMTYFDIVNPRFRQPISGHEQLKDLVLDDHDYKAFRKTCLNMDSNVSPRFVHQLVSSALAWLFHMADKTSINQIQNNNQFLIEGLKEKISNEKDEEQRKYLTTMLELPQKTIRELPERTERFYGIYMYICNELVRKLLAQK